MSQPGVENAEVVPGFAHEELEGKVWDAASDEQLRLGLEKAFDYRGDVTVTLKNGSTVEGYLFDRSSGNTLADSSVRVIPKNCREKIRIPYSDIVGLAFSGRDMAAGKSWELWMKKYWERKAAGEKNIGITPENLD